MNTLHWYPGNYQGYGVEDSRVYVTELGQALVVKARDIDADRADPIVMACGLRPAGNGGECWCIAPLLAERGADPPFPNACFSNLQEVESYLAGWLDEARPEAAPITEGEFLEFVRFLETDFRLPGA